ncbi:DnaA regulatory inactivator Hda [Algicola sagamiensis]|uniref:DnaA regulatory inactivator Hda n=1 Tax=Algicola sagamiensis TaxID=163869 RepID=UPI00035C9F39|nr:DnaA regulatory inactivator Hda [Algicola sagamiensis]
MFPAQFALPVTLPDDETFESFHAGGNEQLLSHLKQVTSSFPRQFSLTYIGGKPGSGKSHLLYACCVSAQEAGLNNILLDGESLLATDVSMIEGLEHMDVICLDGVERIAGHASWEIALFNLFNRLQEQAKTLIIAGEETPDNLHFRLPDLISRLQWGLTYKIYPLTDEQKQSALIRRAHLRGLELSDDTARFLLSRQNRHMRSLVSMLDQLDQASIEQKRKLTIPFIKSILQL